MTDDSYDSTDDARTQTGGNDVRQKYRTLSPEEKETMTRIKNAGQHLIDEIELGCPGTRAMKIAVDRAQEAVMWAVRDVTA